MFSIPEFQTSIYDIYYTSFIIFITVVGFAGTYCEIENNFEYYTGRLVLYLQSESYSKDHTGDTADPEPNQKKKLPARRFHYKHLCKSKADSWMISHVKHPGYGVIKHLLQQWS